MFSFFLGQMRLFLILLLVCIIDVIVGPPVQPDKKEKEEEPSVSGKNFFTHNLHILFSNTKKKTNRIVTIHQFFS